jgi:hypothetical protein
MMPDASSKTSSQGGVSPEQQALAQYTFGQNVVGDRALYGGTQGPGAGMGPSTNATAAVAGSRFHEAEQLAQMSDADYKAMLQYNQNQISSLTNIAGQAGQALGGLGGGGGGGGGGVA